MGRGKGKEVPAREGSREAPTLRAQSGAKPLPPPSAVQGAGARCDWGQCVIGQQVTNARAHTKGGGGE